MKSGSKENKKTIVSLVSIIAKLLDAGILISGYQNRKELIIAPENGHTISKSLLIKEISNPTYPLAPALGSSKAKVTMIEFGDYQCHFCAAFQRDSKDSILQNFVNTGQVSSC